MPGNMDPFGGAGMPGLGGMGPKPGQGMDPLAAMLGGIHGSAPAPMGPAGPPGGGQGLPIGGTLPPPDENLGGGPDMGGSGLLQALHATLSGDPYAVGPEDSEQDRKSVV